MFFAEQYSIVRNNSELPVTLTTTTTTTTKKKKTPQKTHESLPTINSSTDDVLKIIRNLHPNKTHGHDITSKNNISVLLRTRKASY